MVNVCNEKMGKPFEKCNSAFDNVYRKCRKKMKIMKFVCKVVRVLQKLCHVVRVGELLCQMTSYVKNQAMKKIQNSEYRCKVSCTSVFTYISSLLHIRMMYRILTKRSCM